MLESLVVPRAVVELGLRVLLMALPVVLLGSGRGSCAGRRKDSISWDGSLLMHLLVWRYLAPVFDVFFDNDLTVHFIRQIHLFFVEGIESSICSGRAKVLPNFRNGNSLRLPALHLRGHHRKLDDEVFVFDDTILGQNQFYIPHWVSIRGCLQELRLLSVPFAQLFDATDERNTISNAGLVAFHMEVHFCCRKLRRLGLHIQILFHPRGRLCLLLHLVCLINLIGSLQLRIPSEFLVGFHGLIRAYFYCLIIELVMLVFWYVYYLTIQLGRWCWDLLLRLVIHNLLPLEAG